MSVSIETLLLAKKLAGGGGGSGGTGNYNQLTNLPRINGVELRGNKTAEQLGLASASDVPSKTSDLTNDSGFLTLATLPIWDGGVSG